ncbi:MAG: aminodeoxychorismate/anthranilate synthase component II [Planctomycetaceae bacterium]|nr:aminodeoxychorismate/anthranilate synthase component II [Planctomycetales bacterium]MCB9938236.1 aminodeoxychorismate/anthranilate synthase component II [Planctomycetaceae bacterium]
MILLIDNYDSFVFNLARYFERLGQETQVVRNDAIDADAIRKMSPAAIVLSPGPCTPNEAGCSLDVVRELWQSIPMLGVCLGHQTIAAAFGATITRSPQPMHGRTSLLFHHDSSIYQSTPSPFSVCRYHSLIVDRSTLPADLIVTSQTEAGIVMGVQHQQAPIVGMQFHPESILTEHGFQLLANFLRLAGLTSSVLPNTRPERLPCPAPSFQLPSTPVTF